MSKTKFAVLPGASGATPCWYLAEVSADTPTNGPDLPTVDEVHEIYGLEWSWCLSNMPVGTGCTLDDAIERSRLARLADAIYARGRVSRSREVATILNGLMRGL